MKCYEPPLQIAYTLTYGLIDCLQLMFCSLDNTTLDSCFAVLDFNSTGEEENRRVFEC